VALAEGPERIGPEWWREERPLDPRTADAETRDYFRIEDTEGRRFWVFRRGLYKPGTAPRWYLHGVFP
jgi:protein ImuB